jgi:phosphoglycolate phosphatase-like HAD superfamily hydrolase
MDYQDSLKSFIPEHDFFIGIDSDGCVFDSMEVKQKEFFIPTALKLFDLYAISGILRKTWEFVNLYSINRGSNRFVSIIKVFDLLSKNEHVKHSGVKLPDMRSLEEWVKTENRLGNESLRKYYEKNHDPDIGKIFRWSEAVNSEIGRWLRHVPAFPHAKEAIKRISSAADLVIVSQTPLEALNREWKEIDLNQHIRFIAAQEHGTKTEHIAVAAKGKYADGKILMIGDAKGDLDAARNNGVLFYPIIPGREDESWEKFISEAYLNFTNCIYNGKYENSLIDDFMRSLPNSSEYL